MNMEHNAALRSMALCALVPALVAALLSPILGVSAFIAAFALSGLVGYPLFLLLRRHAIDTGWAACGIGFILAAAVGVNMFWPLKYPDLKTTSWRGTEANKIYTMIDGIPTHVAWNDFYIAATVFGAIGAFAGLVFWASMAMRFKSGSKSNGHST